MQRPNSVRRKGRGQPKGKLWVADHKTHAHQVWGSNLFGMPQVSRALGTHSSVLPSQGAKRRGTRWLGERVFWNREAIAYLLCNSPLSSLWLSPHPITLKAKQLFSTEGPLRPIAKCSGVQPAEKRHHRGAKCSREMSWRCWWKWIEIWGP